MLSRNKSVRRLVGGFTMIELMITLAIAAILAGLAAPSFREFIQDSNATSQSNQMVADMNLARMEAVKNGGSVRVSAIGGDWNDGWVVATDRDRNGAVNGSDQILREAPPSLEGFEWIAQTQGGVDVDNVYFDSSGYLVQTNDPLMFQLKTPDRKPTKCKRVAVGLSGRPEARKGKNNPCN